MRSGTRDASEHSPVCGRLLSPVALQDNVNFYFEAYRAEDNITQTTSM